MYARTNKFYNERSSRINYVRSSIPHCNSVNSCSSALFNIYSSSSASDRTGHIIEFSGRWSWVCWGWLYLDYNNCWPGYWGGLWRCLSVRKWHSGKIVNGSRGEEMLMVITDKLLALYARQIWYHRFARQPPPRQFFCILALFEIPG